MPVSYESMVRRRVASTSIALFAYCFAGRAFAQVPVALAALDQQDCEAAVSALNEGISREDDESFLLAGQMFETGTCLKKDATKAATFYERAARRGNVGGARAMGLSSIGSGELFGYPTAGYWFALRPPELKVGDAPDLTRFATPDAIARTYVEAIHEKAEDSIVYPDNAADQGVHGVVIVRFDPRERAAFIVSSVDNRGSSATNFGPSRHLFERVVLRAYAVAGEALPLPRLPPTGDYATERRVVFDRDRNDRSPLRGLVRGEVR